MAFQKQFKTSYVSYNGWEYYLEIWVNTTAGTITTSEIKLGTGGPVISYDTDNEDRFSPIISSNCVIPLVIESSVQENFVKQLREVYNERDVYVHLYKATEAQHSAVKPLWSGFVLMDLSSTPDEFYPYDFKITAVDGLGLLKDIDFVKPTTRRANEYLQTDMYYGPGRYTFWLKEILLKTGASTTTEGASEDYVFTTAINWYESKMPTITQSLDPFYITKCSVGMFHTKTDNGVFEVTNCYEVLKELLKHWGARMTYWKGQFWIVQIPQYITPDSGTYINPDNINTRTYDKTGSFISSSDNLGDSYYTRYQLNIGDLTGGIQKLTGTEVNYLPQIREVRANNVSFGNGNRYGGFPREFTGNSAPSEIIFQDQITNASASDSFNLVIPLNVTVQNGNPFFMKILFNFYCTDLTDTYYLQYNPTLTHKYYWVSSSQWTTLVNAPTWDSGFISPATGNSNQSQSHSNLEGFNQNILFKLYNTSTQAFSDLDLSGDFKFYLDIDAYGTNISNPGSFRFKLANAGLSPGQFFYPTHPSINVSWTNTLQSNYALQTPNIITNNAPNGNSIIQLTIPEIDPFEGMFVVITNTTGSIYGNSYVSSVSTSDVAIVDFGTLIWGDTLQDSDLGCLQVYNGSSFEKSSSSGNWGNGILTGSLAFTQILLDEYLYGQTKVIESPSMRLVTSVLNRDSSDGSGLRPNYVNPIGRLKESRTNLSDVQYVFKRGAFYTLTDEWDYEGFEIRRDVSSVITTVKEITGPNNPVTGVGSVPKTTTVPNAFGQIISKQIITSTSNSVAAGAITSLPIALINDVVFKVGDYFNVLNSDTNEFIKFELNAQQFSDSSALTVVSKTITDNIPANSIITFNAFDLTSQYQNKTRGTVAGFDITATGIEKSSINITDWLNSDTMSGAAVTNVPTALSVKNYVDGQVGASDTLQEVTDNGNTTSQPIRLLNATNVNSKFESNTNLYLNADYDSNSGDAYRNIIFQNRGGEKMRLTSGGQLGIGTTAPTEKLDITGNVKLNNSSGSKQFDIVLQSGGTEDVYIKAQRQYTSSIQFGTPSGADGLVVKGQGSGAGNNIGIGTSSPSEKLEVVGKAIIRKSGSATAHGDTDLFVTDATAASSTAAIQILGGNAGFSNLQFSDTDSYSQGAIVYGHTDNYMVFRANASEKMRLTSDGNLLLGTTTDSGEKLQVAGDLKIKSSNPNLIIEDTNGRSVEIDVVGNSFRIDDVGNNSAIFITDLSQNPPTTTFYTRSTFSGQVTIPATPIATTDAASKSYVDAQVGATDSLQEVTDNGNTTTNSITIGSSSSPTDTLDVSGNIRFVNTGDYLKFANNFVTIKRSSNFLSLNGFAGFIFNETNGAGELMRLNSTGLGIGTSSPNALLDVNGEIRASLYRDNDNTAYYLNPSGSTSANLAGAVILGGSLTGTTATFSGQVTIPATPVATTDAASKSYVDAHGGGLGPFLPLTGGTLTGDLLLGTTSAPVDLYLFGDTAGTSLTWSNSDDELQFSDNTKVTFGDSGDLQVYYDGSGGAIKSNGDLTFITNNSTKMTLTNVGGNLLLGTTSEDAKLNVNGNIRLNNELQLVNSAMKILRTVNDMHFNTDSTTKMTLTSGGNLGLGVTSPSEKLEVSEGFILANGTGTSHGFELQRNSFDTFQIRHLDGNFTINNLTDSRKDFFINGSGNATFTGSLTGTSATFNGIVKIIHTDSSYANYRGQGVFFNRATSYLAPEVDNFASINVGYNGARWGNVLINGAFVKFSNGATENMRITSGGNLLLGTTTDSGFKLQVTGTGSSNRIRIKEISDNTAATFLEVENSDNHAATFGIGGTNRSDILDNKAFANAQSGTDGFALGTEGSDPILFYTNGLANTNERARITSGGNLLLGTTFDFSAKLQVVSNTNPQLLISGNSGAGIYFIDTDTSQEDYQIIVGANDMVFRRVSDTSDRIRLYGTTGNIVLAPSSGNVLIGTTTDSGAKLNVVGGNLRVDNTGSTADYSEITERQFQVTRSGSSSGMELQTLGTYTGSGGFIDLKPKNTTAMRIAGDGNVLIGSTSDNGQKLQVTGNIRITGGFQASNTGGFLLADTGGSMRYGLKYGAAGAVGATNLMMLTNRSLSSATGGGEVAIAANASTTGVTETEVMRIKANTQSQVSIDGVLSLTSQNTPADPPNRASTIWLDSNFDLKIKITNNSGVTVTKTIVEYA